MSDIVYNVVDPLRPQETVNTSKGALAFDQNNGMMVIHDKGLADEVKGARPWVSVKEFEHPEYRAPERRTRAVFLMPEMPWKKKDEGEQKNERTTLSTG